MIRSIFALCLVTSLFAGCAGDFCDPGTLGCGCLSSGGCRLPELACLEGICVRPLPVCDENGVCTPAIPRCYTPCSNDLTSDDGQVRTCSDDGLMEGCLGGSVCDRGACVPAEATGNPVEPGTCVLETDCPDFQTCIEGRCYSNCEQDSDCGQSALCHRKVCRQICMEDQPCSDFEQVCANGICLPAVLPGAPPAPPMEGSFELSTDALKFSSNIVEAEFTIANGSPNPLPFTIRKKEQRVTLADGTIDVRRAEDGDTPLIWLDMGANTPIGVQELPVTVPANGELTIKLANARNEDLPRWTGMLEVSNEDLGEQTIYLAYSESVRGSWTGEVYYFGNFDDGARPEEGHFPLEAWMADRQNQALLSAVPNSFLQTWGRFRNNGVSLEIMRALMASTLTGSWQFPRVQELCEEAGYGPNARCAPFGGTGGGAVIPYTSAVNINPIPSGLVELGISLNLREATENEAGDPAWCAGGPNCFVGRIDTARALQYGGDPAIVVHFEEDPVGCQTIGEAGCVSYLSGFDASILVGGRYLPGPDDAGCGAADGLQPAKFPWLVPGFAAPGAETPDADERAECRDAVVPYAGDAGLNASYAGANPVPDGQSRRRQIELVDGLLIEQRVMMLIIRERLEPFHGGSEPLYAYAYVELERQDAELEAEDFQGNLQEDVRLPVTGILDPGCDPGLISRVTGDPNTSAIEHLTHDQLRDLSRAVVRGDTSAINDPPLGASDPTLESIHYLCVWREEAVDNDPDSPSEPQIVERAVFDAGPDGAIPCPPGASVIYFAIVHEGEAWCEQEVDFDPAQAACNVDPLDSCLDALSNWIYADCGLRLMQEDQVTFPGAPEGTSFDLVYRCDLEGAFSCDDDRFDLRAGKTFLAADQTSVFFNPIETDIHQAFRYKTQFAARTGAVVGFAPEICQTSSDLIPYCYSPEAIGQIAARVDCAISLHGLLVEQFEEGLFNINDPDDAATFDTLRLYLIKNFAALQHDNPTGDPIVEYGFERLYSELLIMLGDDAYTASFAARFDLAGLNQLAFEGSRFEAGGIDLSGAVGFEMYKLYQASQYFEMVLDRFFELSPLVWRNLEGDPVELYVTPATVTTYLDRVIRASTQNARAWTEIARRYRALNRADLARTVLERAYTRSYQESLIFTQVMTQIARRVDPAALPQVRLEIERAQQRYRMSMLDMKASYTEITDQINYFGLPPDYIPFPALNEDDVNGFEVIMDRAWTKLDAAQEQEEVALASKRDFDVDQAVFQSELVAIRNNFEAQLGEICGTFVASDGRVYPAIARYAHLDPDLAEFADPCGAVGNGELWLKAGDLQTARLELQRLRQEIGNAQSQMDNAIEWVGIQCDMLVDDARVFLEVQGAVNDLEGTIGWMDFSIGVADKALDMLATMGDKGGDLAHAMVDSITNPGAYKEGLVRGVFTALYIAAAAVNLVATTTLEALIRTHEERIRDLQRNYEAYTISRECDYLTAELVFTLREIHMDMELLNLDVLNAIWNIQAEMAMLTGMDNERKRLEAEWSDTDQMTINVAAAQNDPNIRIYKNDAIINADRSFTRALKEAYRATRIYEYYTATTYAAWEKLFLIRMVSAGDYNLANYLAELEEAFYEFEDYFGNPDTRVTLISMRDDVFRIPRYSLDGYERVLSAEERVAMFREKLADPALLDDNGRLTIKFNTGFDKLSPRTTNHKILFIEVEMFGDTGDPEGRVYLNQVGTGVVEGTDGDRRYYAFPPRMAVMNPLFNGDRSLGQDSDGAITGPTRSIYRSYRFRERPFVQTNWELVLNQRTEAVNEDINLGGLDDIVIYVFYTDFTG